MSDLGSCETGGAVRHSPPTSIGRRVILPSQHKRIYLDAMEFSKSTNWNHAKIASELEGKYGVRVPSMTVYFWITRRSNPLGHWNIFELKSSRELAYVLGVMRGDGFRTSDRAQGKEEIRLRVRDADFATHFNEAIARVLERGRPNKVRLETREDSDGATFFHARYSSIQLAELLDRDFGMLKSYAEEHPADFLQGFFDSDGTATLYFKQGRLYLRIYASNTNLQTLGYARRLLHSRFGISSSIRVDREPGYSSLVYHRIVTKRKTSYLLSISGQDSVRGFSDSIGFSIRRKQCVLDDGISLIEAHGSRGAAKVWPQLYEKVGRRWRRRETASFAVVAQNTPTNSM